MLEAPKGNCLACRGFFIFLCLVNKFRSHQRLSEIKYYEVIIMKKLIIAL